MGSNFKQKFHSSYYKDNLASTFQYLLNIFEAEFDWLIFVEGSDDLNLYKNTYMKAYPHIKTKIIPIYGKFNLKELIFKIEFDFLNDRITDKILSSKKMVILDLDYDHLLDIKFIEEDFIEKYNIKYLTVHSLENFFFLEENLKSIFHKTNLQNNEVTYFIDYLSKFHNFIKDYEISSVVKTASFNKIKGLELYDLPALEQIEYYDLKIDNEVFCFSEDIDEKIKKSFETVKNLYPHDDLKFLLNYVSDIGKIRGKLFRKLFYDYISSKKIKKLPDFNKLFLFWDVLKIDLPPLE
jgi:hypothetical protein